MDRREEQPWRDTMQVCLEGHVITDQMMASPELTKRFCPKDGAKTISKCPSCGNAIPGELHIPGVVAWAGLPEAPERCENCGAGFPWSGRASEAKSSLVAVDDVLTRIFDRFSVAVKQMRRRHENRPTIDVSDEYDVQDLLHVLLRLYWDDVREEQWTPSYAGKSARIDFVLPSETCVIEVKMSRRGLTQKELGDQLLVDIARYGQTTSSRRLYCFIFDPSSYIRNPRGIESDLEKQSTKNLAVKVFIRD